MLNILIILCIPCVILSRNLFSRSKSSVINYCVDCKFYIRNDFMFGLIGKEFGKCKLNYEIKEDDRDYLVTGIKKDIKKEYKYCSICRQDDKMCGKEGIQFINKNNK